ncbi:MAG: cyclic pyranopterin monophosphate synthase MoaC [Nitrospirota bacterium]
MQKSKIKENLTHFDKKGKSKMVDISNKSATLREAVAAGAVYMKKQTLNIITTKKVSKGDVFETARLAGVMAAKKTSGLIPLCHPINITSINVDLSADKKNNKINIKARVKNIGQTGVEMEALMAVSVSALTIYDMCKSVDRSMVISDIMLIEKRGGKSGEWMRKPHR